MAFVATNKAPGVYIDEIDVPGPIPGVGTSTAAFIGPALQGPPNQPTFLTSFTQFQNAFGDFFPGQSVYVTHAVRGFFDNGGATCYFVRVSTAQRAALTLNDTEGNPTLKVTARVEGNIGEDITVEVLPHSLVSSAPVAREAAPLLSASSTQAILKNSADAIKFVPGDRVLLKKGATEEEAGIVGKQGGALFLDKSLANSYNDPDATIRIADLKIGQKTLRLEDAQGIDPGSYVSISQTIGAVEQNDSAVVKSVDRQNNIITITSGLNKNFPMEADDVSISTLEFDLIVTKGAKTESFEKLSMDPRHTRYFGAVANSEFVELTPAEPPSPAAPPENLPATVSPAVNLNSGEDDNIGSLGPTHYTAAIRKLEKVDDVNMICIPDRTDQEVQKALIEHCEKMQDRFAILDPRPNATPDPTTTPGGIGFQRDQVSSDKGYAALYYPWIVIPSPIGGPPIKVPPSGHVAGLYARTDNTRGVHKAPANETLRGVLALEQTLTDDEQGPLNEKGINVIRSFPGRGIVVWGARTTTPLDRTQWRYINVRRLMLFLEESIQEGTAFAVFEPNDIALWAKVKRQVTEFLTRVWRDGALVGATADKAFRVRVDEELNPPGLRALGQLIIEVIVFPTTPAEFVVFRVIQKPGGGSFEE